LDRIINILTLHMRPCCFERVGSGQEKSIQSLISTERACVWTLGGMLDDTQFAQLLRETEQVLKPLVGTDGVITFAMPVLFVTANRI
jgi:hypothetical protein